MYQYTAFVTYDKSTGIQYYPVLFQSKGQVLSQ